MSFIGLVRFLQNLIPQWEEEGGRKKKKFDPRQQQLEANQPWGEMVIIGTAGIKQTFLNIFLYVNLLIIKKCIYHLNANRKSWT